MTELNPIPENLRLIFLFNELEKLLDHYAQELKENKAYDYHTVKKTYVRAIMEILERELTK